MRLVFDRNGVRMRLDPDSYKCLEHDRDLTDDVFAQLEAVPVVSFGVAFSSRSQPKNRTFRVVVKCPGGDGHVMPFEGEIHDNT